MRVVIAGPLDRVIALTWGWAYYFTGLTIGQLGIGIIWRRSGPHAKE
jgi:hypothetical protein